MSFAAENEDLRSIKTKKALYAALFSLLKKQSFRKMTIKGICEEASISRAAFYAHFIDKYDLLEHWIIRIMPKNLSRTTQYEQLEAQINDYVCENRIILENLFQEADSETLDIFLKHIPSTIHLPAQNDTDSELHLKNIVLSNIYAGGIISYLSWQIKNKFPADVPPMNRYFYDVLCILEDLNAK